jgi:1,4-alpha-glucan branching enzyme
MQTAATTASNQRSQTVWTRFVYMADDADSVAVAGDFSQWRPIPLSPHTVNGKTVWTGLVPVSRGEREYQFVVDGEKWVTDPLAPVKEDDGFGAKNAVLKL